MSIRCVGILAVEPGEQLSPATAPFDPVKTYRMLKEIGLAVPSQFQPSGLNRALGGTDRSVYALSSRSCAFVSCEELLGRIEIVGDALVRDFLAYAGARDCLAFELDGIASYTAYAVYEARKLRRLVIDDLTIGRMVRQGEALSEEGDCETQVSALNMFISVWEKFVFAPIETGEIEMIPVVRFGRTRFGNLLRRMFT